MVGFYSKAQTQLASRPDGKTYSCYSCGLFKGDIENPKLKPSGKFEKGILNIGDFTSAQDDRNGKAFKGKGANTLRRIYSELGVNFDRDCLNVNAVMCHPYDKGTGKPRVPTAHEMTCCRIKVLEVIARYKPKVIILFGKFALQSVVGTRWKSKLGGIDMWRGFVIPDQHFKCWIAPVHDPSLIKMHEKNPQYELIWKQDLKVALSYVDKPFAKYKDPNITILKKSLKPLKKIKPGIIAFDFETTGLKPHRKAHEIICTSIATSSNDVFVFMQPKKKKLQPFVDVMQHPHIKKVAQNMKFEETWCFYKCGTRVKNWHHDTMLATHVLDNRRGITGLKFQAYVMFGIDDYSSDIKRYLQAKAANDTNSLKQFVSTKQGEKACLTYCAFDSILTYRLAKMQLEIFAMSEDDDLPF